MATVVDTICSYIQTDDDVNMIVAVENALSGEATLDDKTISSFARCDERYTQNVKWMSDAGEAIVLWIRTLSN